MKNILVVHHSADLYGADRVILALVSALDRDIYFPIVLLPFDGPLVSELKAAGVECHVAPITRLSRASLSLSGLLRLPVNLIRSIHAINSILNGRRVDLVHSNTLAMLSGALWASWHHVPHVWHVHEIIVRPILVRKVYALLLVWFADCVICVSHAARENLLQDKPALGRKIQVIWNGISLDNKTYMEATLQYQQQLKVLKGEVLVALVGRINRLKGQRVLVEAAGILWQQGVRNLRFVIVGSVWPGQEILLDALQQSINESPARQSFVLKPFNQNIGLVWDACDIAVIPSTEPESFGMVALEAMAASKPVIASNLGGLPEIVLNGETGLLIRPGSAQDLAAAILRLALSESERKQFGENGYRRACKCFSLDVQLEKVCRVYNSLCFTQP